jgi:myosin heavy subunit
MTGERNYHIFYDLLRGGSADSSLCLDGDPMDYYYLNQSVPPGQVELFYFFTIQSNFSGWE